MWKRLLNYCSCQPWDDPNRFLYWKTVAFFSWSCKKGLGKTLYHSNPWVHMFPHTACFLLASCSWLPEVSAAPGMEVGGCSLDHQALGSTSCSSPRTPPIPAHSSPSPWTAWAVTCSGKGVRGLCSPPSHVANKWDPPEQKRVKDAQPAWPKPLCFVQPHALCWAQVLNTQPNILYLEGPKPGQDYKHNVQESKQAVVPPCSPRPGYSLLFSFGSVTEEEEGCGQEEHPSQDNDKRAEHERVAQAEELPHRGLLCALSDQVGDLRERGKKIRHLDGKQTPK